MPDRMRSRIPIAISSAIGIIGFAYGVTRYTAYYLNEWAGPKRRFPGAR
jgi:hypothetical protein